MMFLLIEQKRILINFGLSPQSTKEEPQYKECQENKQRVDTQQEQDKGDQRPEDQHSAIVKVEEIHTNSYTGYKNNKKVTKDVHTY